MIASHRMPQHKCIHVQKETDDKKVFLGIRISSGQKRKTDTTT